MESSVVSMDIVKASLTSRRRVEFKPRAYNKMTDQTLFWGSALVHSLFVFVVNHGHVGFHLVVQRPRILSFKTVVPQSENFTRIVGLFTGVKRDFVECAYKCVCLILPLIHFFVAGVPL